MSDPSLSQEDLWKLTHGEVSMEERDRLQRLVEQDLNVKESAEKLRALDCLLREAAAEPGDDEALVDRILHAMEAETSHVQTDGRVSTGEKPAGKRITFPILPRLVAMAAAMMVLVVGGLYLQQPMTWDVSVSAAPQWRDEGTAPAGSVLDVKPLIEGLQREVEAGRSGGWTLRKPSVEVEATHLPEGRALLTCRVFAAGAETARATIEETLEPGTSALTIQRLASEISDALAAIQ